MRHLTDFIGAYSVARRIEDHRSGGHSRFQGTAQITEDIDGARYVERGQLIMGDQRFEAERSYLWKTAGTRISVLFADGRPFHDFDPEAGGQAAEHLCGADLYRGGYDLSDWPRWSVTWDVWGPRKDYRSVTTFLPKA